LVVALVAAVLTVSCLGRAKPAILGDIPPESRGAEFTLDDQYGKNYVIQFPLEKPLVLVFADKQGSGQIEGWVRPLYERYLDKVDIWGVAKLDTVPEAVRGMVVGLFKMRVKYSVMLDWEGTVSNAYGYPGEDALLVVLGPTGAILRRSLGRADEPGLEKCHEFLDPLVDLKIED
jgi:hypothetical protein